jgi:hypothetical protein
VPGLSSRKKTGENILPLRHKNLVAEPPDSVHWCPGCAHVQLRCLAGAHGHEPRRGRAQPARGAQSTAVIARAQFSSRLTVDTEARPADLFGVGGCGPICVPGHFVRVVLSFAPNKTHRKNCSSVGERLENARQTKACPSLSSLFTAEALGDARREAEETGSAPAKQSPPHQPAQCSVNALPTLCSQSLASRTRMYSFTTITVAPRARCVFQALFGLT